MEKIESSMPSMTSIRLVGVPTMPGMRSSTRAR